MAGTQLTGLVTGMDWASVVTKLMEVNQVPQDKLRSAQSALNQRSNAITSLKTLTTSLQTSLKALQEPSFLGQRTVASSETTGAWAATAATGASVGTCKVEVLQLARAAQLTSGSSVCSKLSATSDVSGVPIASVRLGTAITPGTFTVNGSPVTVAASDSLADVFSKLATASGGSVTAAYHPGTDRVELASATPITLGSAADTSSFLDALQLYTNGTGTVASSHALSSLQLNVPLAQAGLNQVITNVDASGAGSFTVNGHAIAYNVNSDSLDDVLARVNSSAAGVTLGYDRATDKFTITSQRSGDLNLTCSEAPGGLLAALQLTTGASLQRGANLQYRLNDGAVQIAASGTLDTSAAGSKGLSVTPTSLGTQKFTVSAENKDTAAKLGDFVAKYNAVQNFISENTKVSVSGTKVSAGMLHSVAEVTELGRSLRQMIFQPLPTPSGTLTRLADLGLNFSGPATTLTLSESTLSTALAKPQVAELFSSQSGSPVSQLDALLKRTVGTSGSLPAVLTRLGKRVSAYDSQISAMQRRLDAQKAALQNSFIQMETAQAALQQQSKSLTAMLSSSE